MRRPGGRSIVMRRVSLIVVLCIVAASCTPQPSQTVVGRGRDVFRGDLVDQAVRPVRQSIELRLDPEREDFSGGVVIDLEVEEAVESFTFHGEQMEFDVHELEGPEGPVEVDVAPLDGGLVRATPASPLAPGRYRLALEFSRTFESTAAGLYRMTAGDDAYLFTQFEPIDARRAFPC